MRCTKNCSACSRHWSTERARFLSMTKPATCLTPVLQKLNELGCEVLPHSPFSPDLSSAYYHFFKHLDSFLQGKHLHNQQEAENAFQEFVKSQSMDFYAISSVQFSSVAQSCPTLCHPMNRSMPGLPVHHQLPEFTRTHIHRVSDAIQPSHPLSSPFSPAPNPSQHQSLFQ